MMVVSGSFPITLDHNAIKLYWAVVVANLSRHPRGTVKSDAESYQEIAHVDHSLSISVSTFTFSHSQKLSEISDGMCELVDGQSLSSC